MTALGMTAAPTAPRTPRLAWLDALRGFAALVVALFHLSPQVLGPKLHMTIYQHLDLGKYGVLLFFVVSGYVIPMSLERHGDLRRFWIGRLARIYPAYLAAIALFALACAAGWLVWPRELRAETVTGALAHVSMLTDLLGQRGAVRVFWTLAYEMTFYLIVSGLFVWRLHRLSAWWAAGLALAALLLGPALPDALLGGTWAARRVTAAVLLLVVALCLVAYLRNRMVLLAGAAGIALVLLPALNGHATGGSTVISSWQGLLLLAFMFAGTVVYRAQHGQIGRGAAALSLTVVALGAVGAHWVHLGTTAALGLWLANVGAVAVTFGFAYALRNRTIPAVLGWLGKISYSLYLLHVIVLFLLPRIVPDLGKRPVEVRVLVGLAWLAVVIGLAWLAYRMVELPGQALGRRLTAHREPHPVPTPVLATQRAAPGTGRGENERQSV
jgi:peptidoglycan/LPS O-acetylase OafA/YrhL